MEEFLIREAGENSRTFLSTVKDYLRRYRWCMFLAEFKWCMKATIRQLNSSHTKVVSLEPASGSKGNVLLSYVIRPFLLKPDEPLPIDHTNYWESLQIAKTFLELGYNVDVISEHNTTFYPTKDYAVFVGHRLNFELIAKLLNKDCLKILHLDTAHSLFLNAAEAHRLLQLQRRKGCTLRPRAFDWPHLAIEHAHCATILGNEFTIRTFSYACKPVYRIPISTPFLYPWPESKDFEACRNRYLWFGSRGFVRKGLDLVLDAFSEMPEYHLTVCGPIDGEEQDFVRAYHKELYETPNIKTVGWVDIDSSKFLEIMNDCNGLIFPSSCEGQSGGVVTCLHGGLIPILSYESGVDIDDFGLILKSCSIDEIKNAIRNISSRPPQELERMARSAWEFARANHTRERFAEEYRKTIVAVLATHAKGDATVAKGSTAPGSGHTTSG